MRDGKIDKHVAGSDIERVYRVQAGARRQHREICDAADIQRDAILRRIAQEKKIRIRNQWRALSACGDVGDAEVGDARDAGAGGDDRGLADMKRRTDITGYPVVVGQVVHGLTVRSDEVDRTEL